MKQLFLTLALSSFAAISFAQDNHGVPPTPTTGNPLQATPAVPAVIYNFDDFMKLSKITHDFGKLPQGPSASTEFTVTNIGKDSVVIENVQPSCGCTVPEWTKTAIQPGKTGVIKAVYSTKDRPGTFNKTLTIKTSRGTKPVYITGEVETLPVGSVPPATNSLIKH
jgi:hypothetical protein